MTPRPDHHSVGLFWSLPSLSGVAIVLVLSIGRGRPVALIAAGVLFFLSPVVIAVHASRRGLPEDRVGMLIIKSVALTLAVCFLVLFVVLYIAAYSTDWG